jgi:hypothetical protein
MLVLTILTVVSCSAKEEFQTRDIETFTADEMLTINKNTLLMDLMMLSTQAQTWYSIPVEDNGGGLSFSADDLQKVVNFSVPQATDLSVTNANAEYTYSVSDIGKKEITIVAKSHNTDITCTAIIRLDGYSSETEVEFEKGVKFEVN